MATTQSFHIDDDLTGAGEFAEGSPGLVLGATYAFRVPGKITHIRWRTPAVLSGNPAVGGLYEVASSDPPAAFTPGTLLDSATFPALTADAWNLVAMAGSGVQVDLHTAYRAAVQAGTPTTRYRARGTFYQIGRNRTYIYGHGDNSGLFQFDNLRNGTFFSSASLAYPRDSFNSTSYFVDVVFQADHECVRPEWVPDLSSTPGLYSFGIDVEWDEAPTILGAYWYQPSDLGAATIADVTAILYDQATEVELASGTVLAANIVAGAWNFIPFDDPYSGSATTTYTVACESAATHGYTNSVALPYTSPDGLAHLIQTRYESGGGYPATEWGSGQHGVDVAYTTGAPAPAEGTLTGNLNLATALTGARASQAALAGALDLQTALTGARASAGALAGALNLQTALSGARTSVGVLVPTLGLAPALTGARASLGALAASLNLTVNLTGSNGEAGRPVRPFSPPPRAGSGFPWPPRPVKSFEEVEQP